MGTEITCISEESLDSSLVPIFNCNLVNKIAFLLKLIYQLVILLRLKKYLFFKCYFQVEMMQKGKYV